MYLRTFLLRNLMCCYTETEVANQTAMKPGGKLGRNTREKQGCMPFATPGRSVLSKAGVKDRGLGWARGTSRGCCRSLEPYSTCLWPLWCWPSVATEERKGSGRIMITRKLLTGEIRKWGEEREGDTDAVDWGKF